MPPNSALAGSFPSHTWDVRTASLPLHSKTPMIRVLVIEDSPQAVANIERLLAGEADMESCGAAPDGTTAMPMVGEMRPDLVLVDMDLKHAEGLAVAHGVATMVPGIRLVVMGIDDDEDTLQQVSNAGANAYLVKPFGADELLATIREVMANTPGPTAWPEPPGRAAAAPEPAAVGPSFGSGFEIPDINSETGEVMPAAEANGSEAHAPSPEPEAAPEPPTPPAAPRPGEPQTVAAPPPSADKQVICVISGKGGAGTSVIATNLALLAANEAGRRVAIVDLDLQHGDIRRMLRVEGAKTIFDVAAASPTADRAALMPSLVDGPAKLMALLPPQVPAVEAVLPPEFTDALMTQMRSIVDIIVVDMPSHLTPSSVAALRAADRVVLICSMSDPGVRATQGMLRLLGQIGIPPERVIVTLNRHEANSDLIKSAVEEALGRTVPVQLPYDAILVSTSINRGAPFVLQKPDAQVSRKVRELAALLFPMPQRAEPEGDKPRRPVQALNIDEDEDERGRRKTKKKGIFSLISKD